MDTHSLQFRTACAVGLLAAVLLAAAAWPWLQGPRLSPGGQLRLAMERTTDALDDALLVRQRLLTQAAERIGKQGAAAFDVAFKRQREEQALDAMFDELVLLAADGRLLRAEADEGAGVPLDRHVLRQALAGSKLLVSAPSFDRGRHPVITLAAPVMDAKQRVLGVLGGKLDLERQHLFDVITEASLPALGRLQLSTGDGVPLVPLTALPQEEGDWHARLRLSSVDWVLSGTLPVEALSRPLVPPEQLAAGVAAGVLLLALLAWFVMGRWLAPLRQLRQSMETLRTDAHAHYVPPLAACSEIATLAESFGQLMRARRHAVQDLMAEKEWVAVTLDSIADAVVTTDALGVVEYLNRVAEELTGWQVAQARGRPLASVLQIEDEKSGESFQLERALNEARPAGTARQYRLIRRDGRAVPIDESSAPIRDEAGQLRGLVFVFRDVTQQRKATNRARWDAEHDPLTGLWNRRAFEDHLSALLRDAGKRRLQSFLMLLDLDHFKQVNDTGGHAAGDALLKQIARLMQGKVRSVDMCARLGGDEFAILLQNCPVNEALQIAHKIRKAIHDLRFPWEGENFSVGVSIGGTAITHETVTMRQAMQQADEACYQSKAAGRNQVALYASGIVAAENA